MFYSISAVYDISYLIILSKLLIILIELIKMKWIYNLKSYYLSMTFLNCTKKDCHCTCTSTCWINQSCWYQYWDVLPVPARACDVLLQVAGEALDGEAAGHQLLHHQHHLPQPHPSQPWALFFINISLCLPFVYFCFIYFILFCLLTLSQKDFKHLSVSWFLTIQ